MPIQRAQYWKYVSIIFCNQRKIKVTCESIFIFEYIINNFTFEKMIFKKCIRILLWDINFGTLIISLNTKDYQVILKKAEVICKIIGKQEKAW